ncbi:MAG: helix-turn-helix domain-containing protein, partial [Caulobacteraceae bacterium]
MLKTRRAPGKDGGELASAELALEMVEWLATADRAMGVTEAAQALETSKSRAHRHLRVLVRKGFARQDETGRYDIAVKLVALGERVRERFDIVAALRGPMARLRDETGLAVTVSTLVEGEVVILELLQGRMLIDFGVKPGAKLDLHA